ncbi:hypothetical protein [Ruminococcus difficilis]|uniref:Uncharacterized protein n=1 Tax=Ruminococcus difficilis TaxID=2763069 RepID=A0A934WR33_9FIRM|nr:hypothetical protein [Ruminococcus difficilis]MBK6087395.1 hypothetical protein [Ruminococcus difficilis]
MSFPNAAKGIKKIYRAEILKLISYICLFFAAVTGAIAFLSTSDDVTSASSEALSMGGFIGAILFGAAFGILMIIAFILNLVGYINARNDNENFKTALVFLIVSIVFSIISVIVLHNGLSNIIYSMATLSETLATIFVIAGVMQIANQLGRDDVNKKGATVLKLIITAEVISFILTFISTFLRGGTTDIISTALFLASLVVTFIKFVMYLSFLSKSKKMLQEAQ